MAKKEFKYTVQRRPAAMRTKQIQQSGNTHRASATILQGGDYLTRAEFAALFEKVIVDDENDKWYIKAKRTLVSLGDMAAFAGADGGDDDSGNTGGTAYNRLDAWADYSASKASWVLSAGLGADLNTRLSAVETNLLVNYATTTWVEAQGYLKASALGDYATKDWVEAKGYLTAAALGGYATQTWVNSQGFLTSDALGDYATKDWVEFKNYLTSDALNGYATQSWVNAQKYIKESDYASILDTRYYTEDEIDDKLGGYIASSGGIMTGALSFNRPGSRYGFYIEALDDGSMRVNATLDDQYLKGLFTFEYETRQFSLYKAYIAESLALDNQSVIYGSPAISDTQRIYLNHEKTVWVRYNATLNAIECSHAIVSHGDVAAFIE